MNPVAASTSLASYKPALRPAVFNPLQLPQSDNKVATEVASLSLETKLDLSQKAQVVPPPAPPDNRKSKAPPARKPETPASVETTDFTGRTCTGSLNGPLLMEDLGAGQPLEFRSLDFVYDNPQDFAALQTASQLLAGLEPEVLLSPGGERPLADFILNDSTFSYYGVKDGRGLMVQHLQEAPRSPAEESQILLPDGQVAHLSRESGQLSIYLPAASLQEMAAWGGRLLAEA
ncbi:hypothetical protein IV102_31765 [bacterium]|nr:hypothetical protein [bacterium]